MSNYSLIDIDSQDNVFDVICLTFKVSTLNEIRLYVQNSEADYAAKQLSLKMPGTHVFLEIYSRYKAQYINGERIVVTKMEDFYDNLTPEQIKKSKIFCDENNEWI